MSAKRGPKRRRKPASERKTERVEVLLSPTDKARLDALLDREGLSAGEWVRRCLAQGMTSGSSSPSSSH